MSAAARKMMERMGWKEGQGLGKDKDGVKSYLKVVRRDAHTATGLGHMADPAQGGSLASTHAVELDGVYSSLAASRKKKQRNVRHSDSEEDDTASATSSTSSSSSEGDQHSRGAKGSRPAQKKSRREPSSSSSSSSGSDGEEDVAPGRDVTRMSDADLFARCGGVRLGRAGRHRFFDGKLSRIAGGTASSSSSSPTSPSAPTHRSHEERANGKTSKRPSSSSDDSDSA